MKISIVKLLIIGIAMLMLGSSEVLAQVGVSLPTLTRQQGTTEFINVTGSNFSNATSFQFIIRYNKSVMFIDSAYVTGLTASGGFMAFNADTANQKIEVAFATDTGFSGTGAILKLKAHYLNVGTSPLTFDSVYVNGSTSVSITNGSVTVPAISISVGNVTGNGGDTILIPINTTALTSGNNVTSFDFTSTFDHTKIKVIGYSLTGTLGAGGTASINTFSSTSDSVKLAWASANPIVTTGGILVYLKAVLVGQGSSTVSLPQFKFNAGSPSAGTIPGTVTINNLPPHFNAIPSQSVKEMSNLAFTVSATDLDGDPLTYSAPTIATDAPGASFNATTHVFSWTPSFTQAGSYTVKFFVTDGTTQDSTTASITVSDSNRVPTLTFVAHAATINQGDTLTVTLNGADADVDNTLTYSGTGLPAGSSVTTVSNAPSGGSGKFGWRPTFSQSGTFHFTYTVTDNHGASASVNDSITVNVVNNPPSWTAPGAAQMPDTTIRAGQTLTFTYIAIDPEGRAVKYYKTSPSPAGSTIDANTGVFTWTPTLADTGSFQVVILASDSVNTTASRITTVTVLVDHPPVITLNPAGTTKTVAETSSISFGVTASDPDAGDVATLTHGTLPSGATFSGGIFGWTPALNQMGTYTVTFYATDLSHSVDSVVVTINVTKTNIAPHFTSVLHDTTVTVGATITFNYAAQDSNGDALTFGFVGTPPAGAAITSAGVLTYTTQASTTTTFVLKVYVTDGSLGDTTTANITVNVPFYGISGTVTYHNGVSTPLAGLTVTLTKPNSTTATTTTDANGNYSFGSLVAGAYMVSVAKTTGWGGVNASDALLAARFFQGLTTLDSLQQLAADVTDNGLVNSSDALAIVQRYVGIITSFTRPDWVFLPSSTNVTLGTSSAVANFQALATGDVNESLVPTAGPKASSINLQSGSALKIKPGSSFEVPISVTSDMEIGAISLKLTYPVSQLTYVGISSPSGLSLITNEKDGVITLAWADLSGGNHPYKLSASSLIASIKFIAKDNLPDGDAILLSAQKGSEIVDAKGNTVSNSTLSVPSVSVSIPKEFSLKQNYPNPFNPSTTIEYSIVENGNVSLTIYNLTGQEITKLVSGVQNAGSHTLVWNASNLSSGIYFYRLSFDGPTKKYTDIKSMVLLK